MYPDWHLRLLKYLRWAHQLHMWPWGRFPPDFVRNLGRRDWSQKTADLRIELMYVKGVRIQPHENWIELTDIQTRNGTKLSFFVCWNSASYGCNPFNWTTARFQALPSAISKVGRLPYSWPRVQIRLSSIKLLALACVPRTSRVWAMNPGRPWPTCWCRLVLYSKLKTAWFDMCI